MYNFLRPGIEASNGSTIELGKKGFLKRDGIDKKFANEACIIREVKSIGSWSGPLDRLGKLGDGIMKLGGNGRCPSEAAGWSGVSAGDFKNISGGTSLSDLKQDFGTNRLRGIKIIIFINFHKNIFQFLTNF